MENNLHRIANFTIPRTSGSLHTFCSNFRYTSISFSCSIYSPAYRDCGHSWPFLRDADESRTFEPRPCAKLFTRRRDFDGCFLFGFDPILVLRSSFLEPLIETFTEFVCGWQDLSWLCAFSWTNKAAPFHHIQKFSCSAISYREPSLKN